MEPKKKLIYVLTNSNFETQKKGFVHTENVNLVKAGFEVKSITYHRPGTPNEEIVDSVLIKRFRYLPERYEIKSSIQQQVNKSKFGLINALVMTVGFFFFTFSESIKQRPDLFVAHWAFPTGYIASLMSRIFRKKCVIEIHGSEVTLAKKSKFLQKILIPSMNKSALVIANSNYTKDEFVAMGVKKDKIIQIGSPPNYVNHSSDVEFLKEFRRKFVDDSYKIILFVGNLIELKGTEYAIRSLSHIQNEKTHLIIAGDGVLLEKLKELSKTLRLENRVTFFVTFFGRASPEELGWLHDISDVFVCSPIVDSKGFTENLCKTIPEAMESGLPVIATQVGGIPEVVHHEENGLLVNQKDPVGIANAIDRIFMDEKLKENIIKNSQQIVKEFSLEKLEEDYINAINNIID